MIKLKNVSDAAHNGLARAKNSDLIVWQRMMHTLASSFEGPAGTFRKACLMARSGALSSILKENPAAFSNDFIQFIEQLEQNGLLPQLKRIVYVFDKLLYICGSSARVTIESAWALPANTKQEIEARLKRRLNVTQLITHYRLTPNLISGIKISTPEGVLDNSIKYKLDSYSRVQEL